MAQKLIRDIPDDVMAAIEAKAAAAGKKAETWIRDLLIQMAGEPIVRERYAIRFYADETPARGLIRRMCGDDGGIGGGPEDLNPAQTAAYERAKELILHNGPGDREEAIYLLKSYFDNVFEVPV